MALADRPPFLVGWRTGLPDELLKALGHLAVVSAQIEDSLHRIYWKHAALTTQSGPIVTDNLNPKRLAEDILKFVALDESKARVLADLKVLIGEFEVLNTKRNQCTHWMWSIVGQEIPQSKDASYTAPPPPPYKVLRPIYRQRGERSVDFRVEDVEELVNNCSWLLQRLRPHGMEESDLRHVRAETDKTGEITSPAMTFSDLFYPAPWLDKPPNPAPEDHREEQR